MRFSDLLKEKRIKKNEFIRDAEIGKTTLTYYLSGKRDIEGANRETLERMAGILNISVDDLIDCIKEEAGIEKEPILKDIKTEPKKEFSGFIIKVPEKNDDSEKDLIELSEHILQPKFNERLVQQYKGELISKDRQGVYAYTQKALSYNSSRIEGNTLTPDETAELFNTGSINSDGSVYRPKDVEEMSGHFSMFNRCILTLDKPLDLQLIKDYHFSLQNGVFEFIANGGVPGEFKKTRNIVSDITTVLPEDVPYALDNLLKQYHESEKNLESLAKLHAAYEMIHPFKDGNGRTGRMIIFREALLNGIDPFIIQDSNKMLYYKVLHAAQTQNEYDGLINFFKDEQKSFLKGSIPYVLAPEEYYEYLDNNKNDYTR